MNSTHVLSKHGIMKAIFFIILVVLFTGSFYDYDFRSRATMEEELKTRAGEDIIYMKHSIEEKLENVQQRLQSLSYIAGYYEDLRDPEFIKLLYDNAINNDYKNMAITLPDGTSYTSNGQVHNSSDREYFIKGMMGESSISDVLISRVDNNRVISISTPVKQHGSDDIIGVLRSTIETNTIKDVLDVQTSSLDGLIGNIIQSDGTIITMSEEWPSEGYYDYLSQVTLENDITIDEISRAFQNKERGSFSFTSQENSQFVYYEPIKNTDWMVVVALPYTVISSRLTTAYTNILHLETKLFAIAGLGFAYFLFSERNSNKAKNKINKQLDAIIKYTPGCILRIQNNNMKQITVMNDELFNLTGYSKEEFHQDLKGDFTKIVYEDDYEAFNKYSKSICSAGQIATQIYRLKHKNGSIIWLYDKRHIIEEDHTIWSYISLVDITETKLTQEKLRISEKRYQMILEQTESVFFEWNLRTDEIQFSEIWETKYGYPLHFTSFMIVLNEYDDQSPVIPLFEALIRGDDSGSCELHLRKHDQTYQWCKITARSLRDDDGYASTIIGSIEDIDDVKVHTMHLEEKSKLDGLTKLYNKTTIERLIEDTLSTLPNQTHVLFVIDVDDFKMVNDTFGHFCGDTALRNIANVLQTCFRADDFIGRIGGDEFVVLMCNIRGDQEQFIQMKLQALRTALMNMNTIPDYDYPITCSIGIAIHTNGKETYYELFKRADKALYDVKNHGKDGFSFVDRNI